jgi:hypothetical protein
MANRYAPCASSIMPGQYRAPNLRVLDQHEAWNGTSNAGALGG